MLFRSFKEGRNGTGKLSTPGSHVDGENGAKTIVYNAKKDSKGRGGTEEKQKNSERLKKYNSKKKEFYTIDHTI